jgi:hypothetical protein
MTRAMMQRTIAPAVYDATAVLACDRGPGPATVALRRMVMGWIARGPAAALLFAILGTLIGLLSRRFLPTRSIFELMGSLG